MNKHFKSYIIVFIGSLFYCYEFFLRVSPSAISDILMKHFSVSASSFALMSAAFFYAYMPMQVFVGMVGDKYGVKKVLCFCILVCSLATWIFMQSNNIWIASLARFLMGLSASFAYVAPLILAGNWLQPKYYAASAGLIQVLGSFGAYLVGTEWGSRLLQSSWQETYFNLCLIGLVLVFLVMVFVKNSPDIIKPGKKTDYSFKLSFKELLANKITWLIALLGFAFWAPMSIFGELWGPAFLHHSEHVSMFVANSQMQYLWIGVAVGGPAWGFLSCNSRALVTKLAYAVSFLASIGIFYLNIQNLIVINILLFFFGFACSGQCLSFGYMQSCQPNYLLGAAVGFTNMFVILGGTVLQPLSGLFIDFIHSNFGQNNLFAMKATLAIIPVISIIGFMLSCVVNKKLGEGEN